MSWNGDGISRVTAAPASAAASRSLSRTGSPGFNVSVAIPAGGASVAGADGPVAAGAVSVDFTSCFFAQPKAINSITERTTGVHFQKFRLLIPVSFLRNCSRYLRGDHAGEPTPESPEKSRLSDRPSAEIILSSE